MQDALHGLLVEQRADRVTEHEPSLLEGPERKRGGMEVPHQRPVVVERAELADVPGARGALHDAGDERERASERALGRERQTRAQRRKGEEVILLGQERRSAERRTDEALGLDHGDQGGGVRLRQLEAQGRPASRA